MKKSKPGTYYKKNKNRLGKNNKVEEDDLKLYPQTVSE